MGETMTEATWMMRLSAHRETRLPDATDMKINIVKRLHFFLLNRIHAMFLVGLLILSAPSAHGEPNGGFETEEADTSNPLAVFSLEFGEPVTFDSTAHLAVTVEDDAMLSGTDFSPGDCLEISGSRGSETWGTEMYEVSGGTSPVYGVEAKMKVHPSGVLPSSPPVLTLYAPALEPPPRFWGEGNAPRYESLVWYSNIYTPALWAVFEHCGDPTGSFVLVKLLNSEFTSKYVDRNGYIYTRILHFEYTAPIWAVYLYNYDDSIWELQIYDVDSSCEDPHFHMIGWDWFEWGLDKPASSQDCPSLPTITSKDLKIYLYGSWRSVTSRDSGVHNQFPTCDEYDTVFDHQYYHWHVSTP